MDSSIDGYEDAQRGEPSHDADEGSTGTDAETQPGPEDAGGGMIDHDAAVVPDSSSSDAATPWRPPAVSQVRMTGVSCLSVSPPTSGKCGGYYCGVTDAVLTPEIDPSKPCGNIPAYICTGELETIAATCSEEAQNSNINRILTGDTTGFARDVQSCLASNAQVVNAKVRETCQSCFVQAYVCCMGDIDCGGACLGNATNTQCGQAMRSAGCVDPFFVCSGLPSPF